MSTIVPAATSGEPATATVTRADDGPPAGHEAAPVVYPLLVILGLLSFVAGIVAFAGSGRTDTVFAWAARSPMSAAVLGACFVGVMPLMFAAGVRGLWEEVRIAVVPATILVTAMSFVSLHNAGALHLSGGPIIGFFFAWGWLVAMISLTAFSLLALLLQWREKGSTLARVAPLPRWALPALAVLGAALFGLGAALLVQPDFWGPLVPWQVATVDAQALGVWSLTLGCAVLQALAEDDLDRLKPGLYALVCVSLLCAVATAWHGGEVRWTGWSAPAWIAIVSGMFAAGSVGLVLHRRLTRPMA